MSETPMIADSGQRWAALDSCNERLVDPSHPLLRQVREGRADADCRSAKAS